MIINYTICVTVVMVVVFKLSDHRTIAGRKTSMIVITGTSILNRDIKISIDNNQYILIKLSMYWLEKYFMGESRNYQRSLQLASASHGLIIFSWDSRKFSNFRFIHWWDSPKYSKSVVCSHQIKLLQVSLNYWTLLTCFSYIQKYDFSMMSIL